MGGLSSPYLRKNNTFFTLTHVRLLLLYTHYAAMRTTRETLITSAKRDEARDIY